jgi:extradiol dioxygenase family protein
MNQALFHLAFPVSDIPKAKEFYAEGLGCQIGRETPSSLILNFYGHQIVAHVTLESSTPQKGIYPRHFGLIFLKEADWEALLKKAQEKQIKFYQAPKRRFVSTPIEHRTFFLEDPFSNLLEFKFYCYNEAIFGSVNYAKVGDDV